MGPRMSMDQDLRDCQRLMRGGSKSFFAASRVLPRPMRHSAMALYAFCRVADDAIDLISENDKHVGKLQSEAIESLIQ